MKTPIFIWKDKRQQRFKSLLLNHSFVENNLIAVDNLTSEKNNDENLAYLEKKKKRKRKISSIMLIASRVWTPSKCWFITFFCLISLDDVIIYVKKYRLISNQTWVLNVVMIQSNIIKLAFQPDHLLIAYLFFYHFEILWSSIHIECGKV